MNHQRPTVQEGPWYRDAGVLIWKGFDQVRSFDILATTLQVCTSHTTSDYLPATFPVRAETFQKTETSNRRRVASTER